MTSNFGNYSDGSDDWTFTSLQVTPLMADNHLLYCTPFRRVFSTDTEAGEEEWVFDLGGSRKRRRILQSARQSARKRIWAPLIPYSANAIPISYRSTSGGRQYIVVAAGGHDWAKPGEALVAFGLPHQ